MTDGLPGAPNSTAADPVTAAPTGQGAAPPPTPGGDERTPPPRSIERTPAPRALERSPTAARCR
jgi:hypothetical protein